MIPYLVIISGANCQSSRSTLWCLIPITRTKQTLPSEPANHLRASCRNWLRLSLSPVSITKVGHPVWATCVLHLDNKAIISLFSSASSGAIYTSNLVSHFRPYTPFFCYLPTRSPLTSEHEAEIGLAGSLRLVQPLVQPLVQL